MIKINISGMLLGHTQPVSPINGKTTDLLSNEEPVAFQQFLSMKQHADTHLIDPEMIDIDVSLEGLSELPLDILKRLYEKLASNLNFENDQSEDDKTEVLATLVDEIININDEELEVLQLLESLLDSEKTDQLHVKDQYNQLQEQLTTVLTQVLVDESNELHDSLPLKNVDEIKVFTSENPEQTVFQEDFTQLFAQAEALLMRLSEGQDVSKVSPKILELLEKWASLEGKTNQQMHERNLMIEPETEESKLWERLVSTFHSRNQLAKSQRYNASAQVTSKDIAKWLHNGLSTHQVDTTTGSQQATITSLPMSKIEQYVIHINQTDNAEPAAKQLIDQFQSAMRTSRFLAMNNGVNQLSIALRPDNLGEMMVRLTEINGEMTLKIIVSSQATRQMLESNVHQLKNMFSPHQVVIEEQEGNIQEAQKNHEEQSFNEHEEDHSQQSNKDDSKESEPNFEIDFHELLMNEKV